MTASKTVFSQVSCMSTHVDQFYFGFNTCMCVCVCVLDPPHCNPRSTKHTQGLLIYVCVHPSHAIMHPIQTTVHTQTHTVQVKLVSYPAGQMADCHLQWQQKHTGIFL